MILLNKYLEELGYTQADLPGIYKKDCDTEQKQWNDPRNKDMKEYGFCDYEFFDLYHTFDLLIYPRLCYLNEYCKTGHPMGMTQQQWDKIMNTMIEGFKLNLLSRKNNSDLKVKQMKKIEKAREYFAKYYECLWY